MWRLDRLYVASLSSTLTLNEKKSLKKDLDTINGTLLTEWSDKCTHLTVCTITITPKVLQALSGTVPVVTPSYWTSYIAAARAGIDLPNTNDFVPPIAEPFLSGNVRFTVNVERRRLFVKHEFVFMLTKHMERYESIIRMSGGRCSSMDKKRVQKSSLLKPGVCVVHYNPSTQSQTSQDIDTICEHLRSKGHRTIPECEIGLALLHCSTAKFCNPMFRPDDDFQLPSLQRMPTVILAGETPAIASCNAISLAVEVPETLAETRSESYQPIVVIDDDSMAVSESVPEALRPARGGLKRRASPNLEDSASKRRVTEEDFGEVSRQLLEDDVDLLDSISFEENEVSGQLVGIGDMKVSRVMDIFRFKCILFVYCFQSTTRVPLKPVNVPKAKPVAAPPLEKPPHESSQVLSNSICSSGFISKQKTLPRVQNAPASSNQPIPRSNSQTLKRTFNLLSNDSDSDNDTADNSSGALFKFAKNPVPIKRAKPPNANVAQSKFNDSTDSELFAFSSTASSQKLATQRNKPPAKANNCMPDQSDGRLCRTIMANMLNMSIQPIRITRTGWMSGRAIKKEELTVDGEPSSLLVAKAESDEDCGESKAWLDRIKNPFEVRIKKMNLVNRSTSVAPSSEFNATVIGKKNFKAFVKVFCIFFRVNLYFT